VRRSLGVSRGGALGTQRVGVQFSHIPSCVFSVSHVPFVKVGISAFRRENREVAFRFTSPVQFLLAHTIGFSTFTYYPSARPRS
jgi:hypothetical protein